MALAALKLLRFVTPGVVTLLFLNLLGRITGLWRFSDPVSISELSYSLGALLPAGLYYLTSLRRWANQGYSDEVSEALRVKLVSIAKLPDNATVFSSKSLEAIFFGLVDNDASLRTKAILAYFNGYIWSTLADIRAIGLLFLIPCAGLFFIDFRDAWLASDIIVGIVLLTIPFSSIVTKRHKAITDQQLVIIKQKYSGQLRTSLESLCD